MIEKSKTSVRVIKSSGKEKQTGRASRKSPRAQESARIPLFFRPFAAVGRYFKLSWIELRQVRWPNRRTTWKLTFTVIVYCVVFAALIMLLDMLFQFIFNKALG